jgi:uncharacterized secreted protein with C-terminal beta-propeller domain
MAVTRSSTDQASDTIVHKFQIGDRPDSTRYAASGRIQGHVLNQFAMDERDDFLRIASTKSRVPDPEVRSIVSVLAQRAGKLAVVGELDGIAPGEDIRSVRFDGERAFVVTFKKTDPLYAIDLSQPESPAITGELKIPGFSTYMHMFDPTHLLTVGFDADDQGSFAYFDGVLLQLFDIGDPANPALMHKTTIGTRGSSSASLTDHLAFTLVQDKLALPMTVCEGGGDGRFGADLTFSGLIVYDVSLDRGIQERGRIAHPPMMNTGKPDVGCTNWWSNANSDVQRSIFIDDYVYSIAPDIMRVQQLDALGHDVASVPWL